MSIDHFPESDDIGPLSKEESAAIDAMVLDFEAERERLRPPPLLPELIINAADPTATAKELAAMFASRSNFLSNVYVAVQVSVDADNMPRAIEVSGGSAHLCT